MTKFAPTLNDPKHRNGWLYAGVATLAFSSSILVTTKAQAATTETTPATTAEQTTDTSSNTTASQVTLKTTATTSTTDTTEATSTSATSTETTATATSDSDAATTGQTDDSSQDKATNTSNATTTQPVATADTDTTTKTTTETDSSKTSESDTSTQATDDKTDQVDTADGSTDEKTTTESQTTTTSAVAESAPVTKTDNSSQSSTKTTTAKATKAGLAKAATTTAYDPDADDTQVITMADANMLAAVKKGLSLASTADLTVGALRNYKGNTITIIDETNDITSLAGLETLQYLPQSVRINLNINILAATVENGTPVSTNFDLTPLENLHFNQLTLSTPYFSLVDLSPLTKIETSTMTWVYLQSPTTYSKYGMTNSQLAGIASWLTDFLNNGYGGDKNFRTVGLSGNQLSDFSSLSGIIPERNVWVYAPGQLITNDNPINIVTGQPVTFTIDEQTGINGETLQNGYAWSFNTDDSKKYKPITSLGNGEYQIDTPVAVTADGALIYGQWGYLNGASNSANFYREFYGSNGADGLTLITDARIYRAANWQDNPSITVNYIDKDTGEAIQDPETLGTDKKIGETVDLTDKTSLSGYEYDSTDADSLTLTYSADPQTVNLYFTKKQVAAGDVTIKYVDTDGNVLATGTATYPDGQWVGKTYTTSTKAIDGYSFDHVDSNGLAANGTLTATGGTVTYVYTKNVADQGQAKVVYMDDTTGKTLETKTLTGDVGTTSDYQTSATIKTYTDRGYQLVMDEYPADGVIFDDQTPTYIVHLKHQTVAVTDSKTVTETIHYVYADGTTAAADYQAKLTFNRTGERDLVTWETTWGDWQADSTSFAAQTSPVIAGYQADQTTVAAIDNVTATTDDVDLTVTYTAVDPTNPETPGTTDPETPDVTNPETPGTTDPTTPDTTTPDTGGEISESAGDTINPGTSTKEKTLTKSDANTVNPGKTTGTTVAGIPTNPKTALKSSQQLAGDTSRPEQATSLPQTNESKTTPWTLAGATLLVGLGLLGYRRKH
ncbi:mucin-binding protein [Lactiplantibacillus daowaiensis]|uniref:MucBP domain-containing protein n=1 Tax=Lactiplantibacillus daowaiensis TaxID=2559918 RepID=A0ABW1S2W9_9LACO|nr:MucBP domain-containing protein [Lactiplantibacillus daowaiensis]